MTADDRVNLGLLVDVIDVLQAHGFVRPTDERMRNRATADTLMELGRLVRVYEGGQPPVEP